MSGTKPLSDDDFLDELYNDIDPWTPVENSRSDLYEPIYEAYAEDLNTGYVSPTQALLNRVRRNRRVGESVHYFSGFRGSGKSTELRQLIAKLPKSDYIVLFSDASDFLNTNAPLEITDLLYSLAVAFSRHLNPGDDRAEPLLEGTWKRLVDYLTRTNVDVSKVDFKLGVVDISAELKNSDSFRTRFRQAFANHVAQLNREVRKYFEDAVKALRERYGNKEIVFIFDNLEKVEGAGVDAEEAVRKSVEHVFQQHRDKLALPNVHAIYTVPPWLRFLKPLEADTVNLSGIRLWKNDVQRTPRDEGLQRLRDVIARRLRHHDPNGWARFFGPDPKAADGLIGTSGGHIRNLFRMMREAIIRSPGLPIPASVLGRAADEILNQSLPIKLSDARLMAEIARTRTINPDPQHLNALQVLLDVPTVLFLQNGEPWYDVLPALMPEVERVIKQSETETAKP